MADVLTEYSYLEMKARVDKAMGRAAREEDHVADPGKESKLAGEIMKWAKERGYPCQCFRQSAKAKDFLVPGWFD